MSNKGLLTSPRQKSQNWPKLNYTRRSNCWHSCEHVYIEWQLFTSWRLNSSVLTCSVNFSYVAVIWMGLNVHSVLPVPLYNHNFGDTENNRIYFRSGCVVVVLVVVHYLTRTHQEMRQRTWTFTQCARKLPDFAVQGHSRSPILLPIESSYTISY